MWILQQVVLALEGNDQTPALPEVELNVENAEYNPNEHPAQTDLMCFSTTAFQMYSSINEIMFYNTELSHWF